MQNEVIIRVHIDVGNYYIAMYMLPDLWKPAFDYNLLSYFLYSLQFKEIFDDTCVYFTHVNNALYCSQVSADLVT